MPDDAAMLPELAAAGVTRVLVPVSTVGLKQRVSGPEDLAKWRDIIDQYTALEPAT